MRRQTWRTHVQQLTKAPRIRHVNLFFAMAFSLLAAVVIAFTAALTLAPWLNVGSQETAPADLTRISLTVAAGVGGVVALVVAYRRQRDNEQGKFVEGFGAAAKQLGDADAAVRMAGVYAMAGVADQTSNVKRQQCIDVLCGYLRLPYSPELGNNHQTGRTLTMKVHRKGEPEEEQHFQYRQNDKEVRQTIVRVIAAHLQKKSERSWSSDNFDFSNAHLEEANFTGATFSGIFTTFNGATFSGYTSFYGATFNGWVADFSAAIFSNEDTLFRSATFINEYTNFDRVDLNGHTQFEGATFNSATSSYNGATFSGTTSFYKANFKRGVSFIDANFRGHTLFDGVTFSGGASFYGASFSGDTSFKLANFAKDRVSFEEPRAWNPAPTFDWNGKISMKPTNVEPHVWPPRVMDA